VIEAAEFAGELPDGRAERGRIGDIGGDGCHRHAAAGQPPGRRGQAFGTAGDDPHGSALGGQRIGDGEPDAPAAAGNKGAGTTQTKIHDASG